MFEYEKDHLHIRGEYTWKQVFILIIIGSPPHTWRIRHSKKFYHGRSGITSTYVENTHNIPKMVGDLEDHLHIRGEYSPMLYHEPFLLGSPPHTWRIPLSAICLFCWLGITSTYVENTRYSPPVAWLFQDHLHIRGEYSKQIPL